MDFYTVISQARHRQNAGLVKMSSFWPGMPAQRQKNLCFEVNRAHHNHSSSKSIVYNGLR